MQKFADFLNTRGAAILILLFTTLGGALMLKWGIDEGSRMFHDSFIALLAILSPAALAQITKPQPPADPGPSVTVQK